MIPLAGYALLSFLSAVFSDYRYHSFHGSVEQQESVFAILGYCLIVYYSFLMIRSDYDIKILINALLYSVLILGAIGLSQAIGHDFFGTRIGTHLITSNEFVATGQKLQFNFEIGRVYLTLFNSNYVGVYTALTIPIFFILLIFSKNIKKSLLYFAALVGLIICAIGSKSIAGVFGLAVAIFCILVFLWRFLIKKFYVTITVILVIAVAFFIINAQFDNLMINRIKGAFQIQKTIVDLEEIHTGEDKVTFLYKGNELNFALDTLDEASIQLNVTDQNNSVVEYIFDETLGNSVITDQRFSGIKFNQLPDMENKSFQVDVNGQVWVFTNNYGDGTYYVYNRYQKWDKIDNPPKTFLRDYGNFATQRGYIWDRSLPLIKENIILGSGPDTFTMQFPQRDYLGFANYGYSNQLITKPHNMYLQIAIQTGMLSLILFLIFYGMYFVSSFRLYIKGRFNSYYAQVGVAIFIGTIAYMVTGLANDSSITTAPVFWTLMGIGIAINHKVKPLIQKEAEEYKAKRLQMKLSTKLEEVEDDKA